MNNKTMNKTSKTTTLLLVVSTLLILALHFAQGGTIIYPNGTTMIDFARELKLRARDSGASVLVEEFAFQGNLLHTAQDLHLSAQGNRIVLQSPDIHLMCPSDTANISVSTKDLRLVHGSGGHVLVDDISLANNAIGVPDDRDLELHAYRIVGVAPSGDFFNFTTKTGNFKLGTENAGNLVLDAGPDNAVQIAASRLDLQGASLNLTGTHVALDEIISQSLLINGTLITTTESDVDIVLSPKGQGKIRVGKDMDVRGVALILDNDQISGDKIEGGTINAVTITTLNATTINADFLGRSIALKPGVVLDVSSGVLQLADDQISGNKIEGGTIDATTITTLTSTTVKTSTVTTDSGDLTLSAAGSVKVDSGKTLDVSQGTLQVADLTVDNVKIDSNAVEATSGDLELKCPVGGAVRVSDQLDIGQIVIKGNTVNTTGLNTNLLLVPHGLGAVKVAEGKTLDLRGVTLLIDNDAISGDKIDGGHIGNVTVNELVAHLIKNGMLTITGETISSTGDIRLSPAGGSKVQITQPLEVLALKFEYNAIGTTTGQPVTINNLTCPIATFNRITVGTIDIEDNEITCTGATCDVELSAAGTGDVVLKSDVVISAGKSITGSTSEAVFQTVKTSTVATTSGDLTLNPAGQNVKIESGKTLDVTGATLKLDDNAISGDKIEGGSINAIKVKELRSDDVSVSGRVQVNGSVEVGSGGVETKGGVRDAHGWIGDASHEADMTMRLGNHGSVNIGSPLNGTELLSAYAAHNTDGLDCRGYSNGCFDGRYVYMAPYMKLTSIMNGCVLRYDTSLPFKSPDAWSAYDASVTDGLQTRGYLDAVFSGRQVVFVPQRLESSISHNNFLFYDTRGDFKNEKSWFAVNVSAIVQGVSAHCGFKRGVFTGRYLYFTPSSCTGGTTHGAFLRLDSFATDYKSASAWAVYDPSDSNLRGYRGGVWLDEYVYFVPSYNDDHQGIVLRYDLRGDFCTASSWDSYDMTSFCTHCRGYDGAVSDGRYIYLAPSYNSVAYNHGLVVRYDTKASFTSMSSWAVFASASEFEAVDYRGALFDGIRAYFVPHTKSGTIRTGRILTYNTQQPFLDPSSWHVIDASHVDGLDTVAFLGAVFDGRYMYYVPQMLPSHSASGNVLRYDTRSPQPRPSIQQIASNKDLFIASDSKVGIGTTSPTEQLHVEGSIKADKIGVGTVNSPSSELDVKGTARIDKVEVAQSMAVGVNVTDLGNGESVRVDGGVMASGGVRDSHAWGSENARRAKLAIGLDGGGGYGSSSTVGGPMIADYFEAMDASATSPGNMKGFYGAVTDGRFVYFVPHYNGDYDGRVLRYDTQGSFRSSQSWAGFDAGSIGPGSTKGFDGGVFDGRYVYFIAHHDGSYHGRFLRYDSQGSFTSSSSWTGFDAVDISPGSMKGFKGGTFDGRYLYFAPDHDGTSRHGKVLRFDTSQEFTSSSSWSGFDASSIGPGNMKGFYGAVFDGNHVYFVPYDDGSVYHGRVLRYDTRLNFSSSSSWEGYDASNTSPGDMVGYIGASFDGRFIYFGPHRSSATYHGRVLRYDTQQSFTSSQSWLGYDAVNTSPGSMRGFYGTAFDGRFVYFVPYTDGSAHGRLLRYDTLHGFTSDSSWTGFDASGTGPGDMKGFQGAVFVDRYIYLAPYHDGSVLSGKVLRYDTRSPQPRPSLPQIATSSELFIASNGSVGIGTTDPGEKLTVEGGVMAKGGVRDSHAWTSNAATASRLSRNGGNSGYYGGTVSDGSVSLMDITTLDGYSGLEGFGRAAFDSRYLYFSMNHGTSGGRIVRYDSQKELTDASAWEVFDTWANGVNQNQIYLAALYVGPYVYFSPYTGVTGAHNALQYDTRMPFKSKASWKGYVLPGTSGSGEMTSIVSCGRFIFYVPGYDHGKIVRYDTAWPFDSSSAWSSFDLTTISASYKLYSGGTCDGRWLYLSPASERYFVRHDTLATFTSSTSWESGITDGNLKGYTGAVFDGRYVYYIPAVASGSDPKGLVTRYDTKGAFDVIASWLSYDVSTMAKAFRNGVYDGRYLYLCGGGGGSENPLHAMLIRHDTHMHFTDADSWTSLDLNATTLPITVGGPECMWDGRFIYKPYTEHVLRYDTRSPQPRPSIQQIASNKDLFIASDSKVGIGTTSPTEQLHVDGNIKVTGTADVTSTLKQGGYTVPTYRYFRVGRGSAGTTSTTLSTSDLVTISPITSSFTAIASKIYRFSWIARIGTVSSYSCYVQCYLYSGSNIISYSSTTAGEQATGLEAHIAGNTLRKFSAGTVSLSMKCRKQGCGSGNLYVYDVGLTVEELEGEEMSHTGSCTEVAGGSVGSTAHSLNFSQHSHLAPLAYPYTGHLLILLQLTPFGIGVIFFLIELQPPKHTTA